LAQKDTKIGGNFVSALDERSCLCKCNYTIPNLILIEIIRKWEQSKFVSYRRNPPTGCFAKDSAGNNLIYNFLCLLHKFIFRRDTADSIFIICDIKPEGVKLCNL